MWHFWKEQRIYCSRYWFLTPAKCQVLTWPSYWLQIWIWLACLERRSFSRISQLWDFPKLNWLQCITLSQLQFDFKSEMWKFKWWSQWQNYQCYSYCTLQEGKRIKESLTSRDRIMVCISANCRACTLWTFSACTTQLCLSALSSSTSASKAFNFWHSCAFSLESASTRLLSLVGSMLSSWLWSSSLSLSSLAIW